jgi:hypothetical protein
VTYDSVGNVVTSRSGNSPIVWRLVVQAEVDDSTIAANSTLS